MKILYTSFLAVFFLTCSLSLEAQIIAGGEAGQVPNTEIKASGLPSENLSADVNPFSGGLNMSYSFGTVSTSDGLSFELSMSYNSSHTIGSTEPYSSGIPYGEGWDLNVPTISIQNEAWRKYSADDLQKLYEYRSTATGGVLCNSALRPRPFLTPKFTSEELLQEGEPLYYSPVLNIPGVVSGRLIYKGTRNNNAGNSMVFILASFDQYYEARFNGSTWEVIAPNGTRYQFSIRHEQQANANDQRVPGASWGSESMIDECSPSFEQQLLPNLTISTWYISQIRHPNKRANITFSYNYYGGFNFHQEYNQESIVYALHNKPQDCANGFNLLSNPTKKTYQEIRLSQIKSDVERLKLEYEVPSGLTAGEYLDPSHNDVHSYDDMYVYKDIYQLSGSRNGWTRMNHWKKGGRWDEEPCNLSNPYVGQSRLWNSQRMDFDDLSDSDESMAFDHGFLESPAMGLQSEFVAGDIYEVIADVHSSYSETQIPATLDLNICSGTGNDEPPLRDGRYIKPMEWGNQRSHTIFSTFNRRIKWLIDDDNVGHQGNPHQKRINALFTLPSLPEDYKSFRVQIGPGIADIAHSSRVWEGQGEEPYACQRYFSNNEFNGTSSPYCSWQQSGHNLVGDKLPNNFGIGVPPEELRDFYSKVGSTDWSGTEDNFCMPFWWASDDPIFANTFDNIPTTIGPDVQLNSFKIRRYCKLPLLLSKVTKEVLESSAAYDPIESSSDWESAWKTQMLFELTHDPFVRNRQAYVLISSATEDDRGLVSEAQGQVTEFHLTKVKRGADEDVHNEFFIYEHINTSGELEYDLMEQNDAIGQLKSASTAYYDYAKQVAHSRTYPVIVEHVSSIGKRTKFEYNAADETLFTIEPTYVPRSRPIALFESHHPDAECQYGLGPRFCDQQPMNQFSAQVNFLVMAKEVKDYPNWNRFEYDYQNGTRNFQSPSLPQNMQWDFKSNTSVGFAETIIRGPIFDDCQGAKTVIEHHNRDRHLWGKVHRTYSYDCSGQLISELENQYSTHLAFEHAQYRLKQAVVKTDYGDYRENELNIPSISLLDRPIPHVTQNYSQAFKDWMLVNSEDCDDWYEEYWNRHDDVPYVCFTREWVDIPEDEQTECIELRNHLDDWWEDYPGSCVGHFGDRRGLNVGDGRMKFLFLEREEDLHTYQLHWKNSYFTRLDRSIEKSYRETKSGSLKSLTTHKDYTYFDADYKGKSDSPAWAELIDHPLFSPNGSGLNDGLFFEPSWQVASVVTSSPDLPGMEQKEEFLYLWDLANDPQYHTGTGRYRDVSDAFTEIKWNRTRTKDRTAVFQSRVTSNNGRDPEHSVNNFYIYQYGWDAVADNWQKEFLGSLEDVVCLSEEENDPDGPDENGCYSYNPNFADYCNILEDQGPHYELWCPCEMPLEGLTPQGGEDPEGITNTPLANNMYLKSVVTQIGEVESDTRQILTFQPNDYNPIYFCDTLTTQTVLTRNTFGRILTEKNERGVITKYEYSPITTYFYPVCRNGEATWDELINSQEHIGLPLSMTVGEGRADALTTEFDYSDRRYLDEVTDANGTVLSYQFDELGRLTKKERNSQRIETYKYNNWRWDQSRSFQLRTRDNNIIHSVYNGPDNDDRTWTKSYVDPLGRDRGVRHDGVLRNNPIYDKYGRVRVILKDKVASHPVFSTTLYNPNHQEFELQTAPRSEVLKSSQFGLNILTKFSRTEYDIVSKASVLSALASTGNNAGSDYLLDGNYSMVHTEDEDGKTSTVYTDILGNTVATITGDEIGTVFKYDARFNLIESNNPINQKTEIRYNYLGQAYEKESVDEGLNAYAFDKSGNPIAVKDNKGVVRLSKYDAHGRVVLQIKAEGENTSSIFDNEGQAWIKDRDIPQYFASLTSGLKEKEFFYGIHHEEGLNPVSTAYLRSAQGNHLRGRIGKTISYDHYGIPMQEKSFSYNIDGFLEWEEEHFSPAGLPDAGPGHYSSRITYERHNLQGSPAEILVDIDIDGEADMIYGYAYDNKNRIKTVFANFENEDAKGLKLAEYEYDDIWQTAKSLRYFASEGLDGSYDPDDFVRELEVDHISWDHSTDRTGRLRGISSHLYGQELYYDAMNVPGVASQSPAIYNGNIRGVRHSYNTVLTQNAFLREEFVDPTIYRFTYDFANRLEMADAQMPSYLDFLGASGDASQFGDVGYSYDKAGNLETISRQEIREVGNTLHLVSNDYNFYYQSGKNILTSVSNNFSTWNYQHDLNGNMTAIGGKGVTGVQYGRANLPYELNGSNSTAYFYDANDMRIYKDAASTNGTNAEEYTLKNSAGQDLCILSGTDRTWFAYGNERIAKYEEGKPDLSADIPCEVELRSYCFHAYSRKQGNIKDVIESDGERLSAKTGFNFPYNPGSTFDLMEFEQNYETYLQANGNPNADVYISSNSRGIYIYVSCVNLFNTFPQSFEIASSQTVLEIDFSAAPECSCQGGPVILELPPELCTPEIFNQTYEDFLSTIIQLGGLDQQGTNTISALQRLSNEHVKSGALPLPNTLYFQQNGEVNSQSDIDAGQAQQGGTPVPLQTLDQPVSLTTSDGQQLEVPLYRAMGLDNVEDLGPPPGTSYTQPMAPDWSFYIYDHLGNTRFVYDVIIGGDLSKPEPDYYAEHILDYYPYGKTLREINFHRERYQTTYHQRDEETGLDYRGARFYDADIGRFLSVDPLAGDLAAWSPYNYVLGNPISLIDPDGRFPFPPSVLTAIGTSMNSIPSYMRPVPPPLPADQGNFFQNLGNDFKGAWKQVKWIFGRTAHLATQVDQHADNGVQNLMVSPVKETGDMIMEASQGNVKKAAVAGVIMALPISGGLVKKLISTEPGSQSVKKIASFTDELSGAKNQDEFNKIFMASDGPAKIIDNPIDGGSYIIDGHHRLKAAENAATGFEVPIQKVELKDTPYESFQEIIDASTRSSGG